jgi:hypothetical protein
MTNKVMTWVLIITLLISQSYAYASVPCELNGDVSTQLNKDMDGMDHSMVEHDMSSHMQSEMQHDKQHSTQHNTQQQAFAMDCCDQECNCPPATYSSATLTHFSTVTPAKFVSDSSGFYLFSIQDAFLASSRKPPIIS